MRVKKLSADKALGRCSWCGARIRAGAAVFGLGAKKRAEADLSPYEGGAVEMALAAQPRSVVAIVPPGDSAARRDGKDMMFLTCSEGCGAQMKSALQEEIRRGNDLFDGLSEMAN